MKAEFDFQLFYCSFELKEFPGGFNSVCIAGLNCVFHRLNEAAWLVIWNLLVSVGPRFLKSFRPKWFYVHGSEGKEDSFIRGGGGSRLAVRHRRCFRGGVPFLISFSISISVFL